MTKYIVCSNQEFSFLPDAPVRIPSIEASSKPLASKLPKGTKMHTRWRKYYQKPDKVGVYQVRASWDSKSILYSFWDGKNWSMVTDDIKNLSSKSHDLLFHKSPSIFQDKTWRGLTTAAYLAS